MNQKNQTHLTPRMQEAIEELKRLITERFPEAAFVVEEGFDPEGIYLIPTVDIADTDDVIAVVGDRLVEMQVDEDLPVYVTPKRKPPAVPGDSQSLTVPGVGRKTPSGEPLNVQPRGS